MVAPECAPAAKAGGLGDVVSGLSRELEIRGNAVEIILPKYASLRYSAIWGLAPCYHDLWVPWYGGAVRCTVWFGYAHGLKCFFIEPHAAANFFGRGRLYGYEDDAERFAFFSKAAVEFLLAAGKCPDFLHCHDWRTGLVPVLLREQYGRAMPGQKVCYTIHNFRHQGTSDEQLLWATQLGKPEYFLDADRLGDDFRYRGLNQMKGGVVYSDFVTTVSPSHADEALYDDGASGLRRTLKEHQERFNGVLNGVDYETWNPETDPLLPAHYSASSFEGKRANTGALRDRFWLRQTPGPIVAYVGRLDEQKGMHLVPVVRATGGMIDTVFDRDNSGRPRAERNGYVFHHTDNQAIESALSRALRLWSGSPREFRNLAVNGMRADYSWARPGREYLDIYQHIEHR